MQNIKNRPSIFISYSHKDTAYVDELLAHMKLLEKKYDFNIWSDRRIQVSGDRQAEIRLQIEEADIAIFLISSDYLSSEWLMDIELPTLLTQADRGETRILPIILRASAWAHTRLAYYQSLPRDGAPLASLDEAGKEGFWSNLYDFLEAQLYHLSRVQKTSSVVQGETKVEVNLGKSKELSENVTTAVAGSQINVQFFISHAHEDGDFAENLKGRMKEEGLDGWIDIDVLEAGVDWRKGIDEAILDSCALILILSPDSKMSEYVTYEWAFALGSGLRVVPLMLRDTPIHPRLEAFQYLDFTNRRARPWDRLFSLLLDATNADKLLNSF